MNISPLITEIRHLCLTYDHQIDEVEEMSAPYECFPSYSKFEKDVIVLVEKHGFKTYSDFEEELLRRVSERWIHNNIPQLLLVSHIDF